MGNKKRTPKSVSEIRGSSPDIKTEQISRLKQLLPEAFSEGKLDIHKLKRTLGEFMETENERYHLDWAGKSEAFAAIQTPTSATLAPEPAESVNFDESQNVFIEGENLEVLKALQKSYHGKIKMIYIDPPYNTGNDSFIYPDKFSESKDEYLKRIEDKDESGYLLKEGFFRKNSKESGHYHSNWLSMMYPRLFLARNLLRDDGVIFVSIDDNEVHNSRLIMNEIFGEENFVSQFIWNSSTGGGIRSKYVNQSHEYSVCYAKNIDNLPMFYADLSLEAVKQYNKKDKRGIYREKDFAWRNEGNNPNQKYFITCPDGSKVKPKDGYLFRFVRETFEEAVKEDIVVFKETDTSPLVNENGRRAKYNIYIKKYLGDGTGAPTSLIPKDLVGISNIGTEEIKDIFGKDIFNNPKSSKYLRYLLKIGIKNNDIILDFFAGSGTTAHAVLDLNKEDGGNRKFICVQLAEKTDENSEAHKAGYKTIADICKERIRRVIKKIQDVIASEAKQSRLDFNRHSERSEESHNLKSDSSAAPQNDGKSIDLGFKVFKLRPSNFKLWRGDTIENGKDLEKQLDIFKTPVKPSSETTNILWELIIKSGYDLAVKIQKKKTSGGKNFYSIADGETIIILEKLDSKTVKEIIKQTPKKVITLDTSFDNNDQLKTNTAMQMKDAGIDFKTI